MKIILFDFDGVIVDSFKVAFNVRKNISPGVNFSEDDFRRYLEKNAYERLLKAGRNKDFKEVFFKNYIPELLRLPIIEGMAEVLNTLCKKYKLIIVSSTISKPIRDWLVKNNVSKYFADVMGADIDKSKTVKIKSILKKYKIDKRSCIFITDTLGDLREANETGISSLAVTYGFHSKEILQKGNPVGFVDSPQEILSKIEKFWGE